MGGVGCLSTSMAMENVFIVRCLKNLDILQVGCAIHFKKMYIPMPKNKAFTPLCNAMDLIIT